LGTDRGQDERLRDKISRSSQHQTSPGSPPYELGQLVHERHASCPRPDQMRAGSQGPGATPQPAGALSEPRPPTRADVCDRTSVEARSRSGMRGATRPSRRGPREPVLAGRSRAARGRARGRTRTGQDERRQRRVRADRERRLRRAEIGARVSLPRPGSKSPVLAGRGACIECAGRADTCCKKRAVCRLSPVLRFVAVGIRPLLG
jgi:hypothetical protein